MLILIPYNQVLFAGMFGLDWKQVSGHNYQLSTPRCIIIPSVVFPGSFLHIADFFLSWNIV